MWTDLRDPVTNKLLAKYDPDRRLLEIGSRGTYHQIDLNAYDPPEAYRHEPRHEPRPHDPGAPHDPAA